MPHIELRVKAGERSPGDLKVSVQETTFKYLMSFPSPEVRLSTYLDRDCPRVESTYAEVFVSDECRYTFQISQLIPGSKTQRKIELPGAMNDGEQLTVLAKRVPRASV